MRRIIIFALPLLVVSILGCDKLESLGLSMKPKTAAKAPAASEISYSGTLIAKVNTVPITLEELNEDISTYNEMVGDKTDQKIDSRDKKIEYLKNELVRRALLYQDALDRRLDKKPDVARLIEKTKMDILVLELLKDETDKITVTSQEIEDYYNKYKDEMKEPEERRIREIVVNTEQEARDILIQLLQGTDFATLAKERSKDPSAKDGGDLGFLKQGEKSSQFDAVAFSDALETGKVSNIFKSPDGYCIIKLEEKRGGKAKTLSEKWDDIKRGLTFLKQKAKIDELVGKLSREAKIEIYEDKIR